MQGTIQRSHEWDSKRVSTGPVTLTGQIIMIRFSFNITYNNNIDIQ